MNKAQLYELIKIYFTDKPVEKVMVFGSYSRNEQQAGSDVDIMIKPSKPLGLFVLAKFKQELTELLKIKVDLSTENGISKFVYPFIKDDLETVYEQ